METKTENPPPSEGVPEPQQASKIIAMYSQFKGFAPEIVWADRWSTWVCKGDIPLTQFDSLQSYLDEFPYQVSVDPTCIVVTDPGFGNGKLEWVLRLLPLSNGESIGALTETDFHDGASECKIWVGQFVADEWMDLTDFALPTITRAHFFNGCADPRILEEYELVSLQYLLPRDRNLLQVVAVPNTSFECVDGKLMEEEIPNEDAAKICAAWNCFRNQPIECRFDPDLGKFLR